MRTPTKIMLLLTTFCLSATCYGKKKEARDMIVVAYVTSWTNEVPDPTVMTHINYAFGHVNETFNGVCIDNPDRLRMITGLKQQHPALKVMLSIGGWGSGRFSEMAATQENRLAFARNCKRVVDEFGLDGIDIDWEYPTQGGAGISSSPDDTKNFTLLMAALRKALGKKQLLTAATISSAQFIDFHFAENKFQRDGYDNFPHIMEHTYNTSPSLFQAARSWSATQLYLLSGESSYSQVAANSISYVLKCQEKEGFSGYFYRDTTFRAPVHFIHQSRDQLFPQALIALCQSQPSHPDAAQWNDAIRRYADYLKRLMPFTEPYGMVPSGIWQAEEYADSAGFHSLHIFAPRNAGQLFDRQLQCGWKIDNTHYLRRFPMSFGIFNGNEAIILSTGKGAAMCGHYLKDDTLLQIGLEQLYWTVGKNPFCQSLIYGEGHRYPSMDSFSSGEITGEIPVGIRSFGDEDVPYWPKTNNACYKEVWMTSAGKFLSLIAEYE